MYDSRGHVALEGECEYISNTPSTSMLQHYICDNFSSCVQHCLKLPTPIKSLVTMKVLIQNERTRWFIAQTLHSAFVQVIMRV